MTNVSFAENMRNLRLSRNLSKRAMAAEIGITAATYAAYESADKLPTLETASKIADAFNVSLDWMCGRAKEDKHGEKPRTWGDIMRLFGQVVSASEEIELKAKKRIWVSASCANLPPDAVDFEITEAQEKEYQEYEYYEADDFQLYIALSPLRFIIDGWIKLLSLYRAGQIDEEMYSAWVAKKELELDEYPIIRAGTEGIDDEKGVNSVLKT